MIYMTLKIIYTIILLFISDYNNFLRFVLYVLLNTHITKWVVPISTEIQTETETETETTYLKWVSIISIKPINYYVNNERYYALKERDRIEFPENFGILLGTLILWLVLFIN